MALIKPAPYKCDFPSCLNVKRECNHWFIVFPCASSAAIALVVQAWDEYDAAKETAKHFCGEACLSKYISLYFQKGNQNG